MTIVCLLGRHGVGKTSIGVKMHSTGVGHVSVGLLRRIAQDGHFPSDVPATLIMALRKSRPGQPMTKDVAEKLIKFALSFNHCVIDGFPSFVEHLDYLPSSTKFVYVWTPTSTRIERLEHRSNSSQRLWLAGGHSLREQELPRLLKILRKEKNLFFLKNANQGESFLESKALEIQVKFDLR